MTKKVIRNFGKVIKNFGWVKRSSLSRKGQLLLYFQTMQTKYSARLKKGHQKFLVLKSTLFSIKRSFGFFCPHKLSPKFPPMPLCTLSSQLASTIAYPFILTYLLYVWPDSVAIKHPKITSNIDIQTKQIETNTNQNIYNCQV